MDVGPLRMRKNLSERGLFVTHLGLFIANAYTYSESGRDQEEGSEMDSHEEASPRDQEQGGGAGLERELDFFCFSCFPTAELRTL